jgi:hypothetical protein
VLRKGTDLSVPKEGDSGQGLEALRVSFPGLTPPLTGLRSMGDTPPTAVAVGQTMSALTGLAWQEEVTVFTNRSTK